ncbi:MULTISPECIES: hypothetical protein [unclassified Streptomyces]|uniref:hypothetical protein n=1 Tax=unclassified Streptomyces TaxID=2593676 RepID=UPI00364862F7
MVVKPYFQVDVPITHRAQPDRRGSYVFTGQADSGREAVRIAREVCDAALAAHAAGLDVPRRRPDGWGARGVRPGWEPDWEAARARLWDTAHGWFTRSRTRGVPPVRRLPGP